MTHVCSSLTGTLFLQDWKRWLVVCFLPHVYAKFCIGERPHTLSTGLHFS